MNKGFIFTDVLLIIVLVITLSLLISSIKRLEIGYAEIKEKYELEEKAKIYELEEISCIKL